MWDTNAGVLSRTDTQRCLSQMPVVLLPVHFDRDPQQRPIVPSCQRSVVIRTFITSDFMTGIPATPGQDLPLKVGGTDPAIDHTMEYVEYLACNKQLKGYKL